MYGTFRQFEWQASLHSQALAGNAEALAATFPDCPAFRRFPPQNRTRRSYPGLAPCLLICLLVGQPAAQYSLGQVGFVSRVVLPKAADGSLGSVGDFQETGRAVNSALSVVTRHQPQQAPEPITRGKRNSYPAVSIAADEVVSFPAEDDFVSLPKSDTTSWTDVERTHKPKTLQAIVSGSSAGKLEFSDESQILSVRLGSLLNLVSDRFEAAEFERLSQSSAASEYVAVDVLAAMGIPIRYDPVYDEFLIELPSGDQAQVPSRNS